MDLVAAILLGGFLSAHFVLGGADVGLGMLLPYLGRDGSERRAVRGAMAPGCLEHEAWLVAAAAVLLGCFPELAARLADGTLPLVLLPLGAAWLLRAAGLWWPGPRGGHSGDALLVTGSWLLAAGWGWLLASLLAETHHSPAPALAGAVTGAAVGALFLAHGLGYAALRLTGPPFQRARLLTGGQAGRHSFLLTSVVMAALPLPAGFRLPLLEEAAATGPFERVLLPALLATLPLLFTAQVRRLRGAPLRRPVNDPYKETRS
ncbi:cytochrome d ubiquinol oxidase subunit II [Streptomyces sp. NPDC047023]|uniref:cytochrome d ubiquinol oxidase subunit II n=1 Tax=Streptomyces sp. NPDC047023 TaxID=3155139 RepID=UPI0033E03560